jgi:phosphoribosyl 1,2-cyclic phosphodiesterase
MHNYLKVPRNQKIDPNEHRVAKVQQLDIEWYVVAWEIGNVHIMTDATMVKATVSYIDRSGDEKRLPEMTYTWLELQNAFPGIHESILK